MNGAANGLVALASLVGFCVLVALYMVPAIIAAARRVTNWGSVFAINLLLGWTLVGWALALAMALRTDVPRGTDPQPWVEPWPWVDHRPPPPRPWHDELADRRQRRG